LFTIPNIITLCNAFFGCLAVLSIFSGQTVWLPWILGICLLADFADGLAARLLKQSSPIGKELDSLADVISFGLVPGAIYYLLLCKSMGQEGLEFDNPNSYLPALGFVMTVFSVLRLAKFNSDSRQTVHFIGLNTPANTIFTLGLLLTVENNNLGLSQLLLNLPLLIFLIALFSFLLISEIPIFSFKFKSSGWSGNEIRFGFLIASLAALIILPLGPAMMACILLYLLSSILLMLIKKAL
jgi:CDP-diacylglycerol---serine O-phosphatidyltransferase